MAKYTFHKRFLTPLRGTGGPRRIMKRHMFLAVGIFLLAANAMFIIIRFSATLDQQEQHDPPAGFFDGKGFQVPWYIEKATQDTSKLKMMTNSSVAVKMDVEQRSGLRYDFMRRQCDNFYHVHEYDAGANGEALWEFKDNMKGAYSNDDYNFTVFTVMKVGSWHWNNLMEDLYRYASPGFKRVQPKALSPLYEANRSVYLRRLKSHYKIIFVRHPLSRAISAWRNKFVDNHSHWYKPWAQRMLRMFRANFTKNDLARPTPTFLEFVRYITESGDNEVHWKPVWLFYRPCRFHFDFIGRLETLSDDMNFLFEKLNIKGKGQYRARDPKTRTTDLELVKKTLATLPHNIFKRLVTKYEEDFRLFGYHVPVNASDIRLEGNI